MLLFTFYVVLSTDVMASGPKELDVRWIRRYRGFCIAGSVICLIQVFLAYIFFTTYAEDGKSLEKYANNKNGHLEVSIDNFEFVFNFISISLHICLFS